MALPMASDEEYFYSGAWPPYSVDSEDSEFITAKGQAFVGGGVEAAYNGDDEKQVTTDDGNWDGNWNNNGNGWANWNYGWQTNYGWDAPRTSRTSGWKAPAMKIKKKGSKPRKMVTAMKKKASAMKKMSAKKMSMKAAGKKKLSMKMASKKMAMKKK